MGREFSRTSAHWHIRACAAALAGVSLAAPQLTVQAQNSAPPDVRSAVGPAIIASLTVSPAYAKTGTVVATGTRSACQGYCFAVWVSHDGGHSWHRTPQHAPTPLYISIGVDADGREVLFGAGSKQLQRSEDWGETWTDVGSGGKPTVLPSFAKDGGVVVAEGAGPADYLIRDSLPSDIEGSSGRMQDIGFSVASRFPNGGRFSPALLAAIDPHSQLPVALRCNAQFVCDRPTVLKVPTHNVAANLALGTALLMPDDYATDGVVFANTPRGIFKSVDGGASFKLLQVAPPAPGSGGVATPMLALAPGYRESGPTRTAYVAAYQLSEGNGTLSQSGGIYSTTDGGTTWFPLTTGTPFTNGADSIAVAPDGRLFAGFRDNALEGGAGLVCSIDNGKTWHASCPSVGNGRLTSARTQSAAAAASRAWPALVIAGCIVVLLGVIGATAYRRRARRV
jgi:photosystem II stability/assembly factor-like uncharacterized protein